MCEGPLEALPSLSLWLPKTFRCGSRRYRGDCSAVNAWHGGGFESPYGAYSESAWCRHNCKPGSGRLEVVCCD